MKRMIAAVMMMAAPLMLTGCAVGDGVAHVVKLVSKSDSKSSDAAPAAAVAAPAAPAPDSASAPPPPDAAPRNDVHVEELAPPPKRP